MFARQVLSIAVLTLCCAAQEEVKKFEFHGTTLGGQEFDQDSFANNVVIVDLWGTWCPPCRKAVPVLVDLYTKYKHNGLEIVGFCYDRSGVAENVDKVRKFAVENKITYALAPGDVAVRNQVEGFGGYPTILMIKGGQVQHTHTGFSDDTGEKIEKWVRQALGLDAPSSEAETAGDPDKEPEVVVPDGKIYAPGNGDIGFELEATDVNGEDFEFASLRGKPVLVAMTSSWDEMAGRTSKLLTSLAEQQELQVVAWHLERVRDPDAKRAAARDFLAEQGAKYSAITTPLEVSRSKVHLFAAVPTLLLFDANGKLVHRENGISDEIERRLRKALEELVKPADK